MAKSRKSRRPPGRNPVIAVRVAPPLHREIAEDAKASERTMSAEMEALLRQALDARKRFPTSADAHAMEAVTFSVLLSGERYARDNGVNGPWTDDLESRRQGALAGCLALINFVSSDAQQQAMTVESLKGRVWTNIVNRPPGQGEAS
jgi:hypothetical protein